MLKKINTKKISKLTRPIFIAKAYISTLVNMGQYIYSAFYLVSLLKYNSICVQDYTSGGEDFSDDFYIRLEAGCSFDDVFSNITSDGRIVFNNASSCLSAVTYERQLFLCYKVGQPDENPITLAAGNEVGVISAFAQVSFLLNAIALLPLFLIAQQLKLSWGPFLKRQASDIPKLRRSPFKTSARNITIWLLENIVLTSFTHALMILSWSTIRNFEQEIEPNLYRLESDCNNYIMCNPFVNFLTVSSWLVSIPFILFCSSVSLFLLGQFIIAGIGSMIASNWPQMWEIDEQTDPLRSGDEDRGPGSLLVLIPTHIVGQVVGFVWRSISSDWDGPDIDIDEDGFNGKIVKVSYLAIRLYLLGALVNGVVGLLGYSIQYFILGAWSEFVQLKLNLFKEFVTFDWANRVFENTSALSIFVSYTLVFTSSILMSISTFFNAYAESVEGTQRALGNR